MSHPRYDKEYTEMALAESRPLFQLSIYDISRPSKRRATSQGVLSELVEPSIRHARIAQDVLRDPEEPRADFVERVIARRSKYREDGNEHLPYTDDEERVVQYIMEKTDEQVGAGVDPIGFLIASHRLITAALQDATSQSEALQAFRDSISSEPDAG